MPAVKHVVIGRCSEYAVACLDEEWDNARRLTEVWNKPSASSTDAITLQQLTLDAVGNRTQVAETLAPILPPPLGAGVGHPDPHLHIRPSLPPDPGQRPGRDHGLRVRPGRQSLHGEAQHGDGGDVHL
jgi:hypothetical protein